MADSRLARYGLPIVLVAALAVACTSPVDAQDKTAKGGPALAATQAKPKVPAGSDPGGVAVAVLGPGVDYTAPAISLRLVRDGEGDIAGLDFIDRDNRPYERAEPRPGTALATAILAEAPRARLVPVRLAPDDARSWGGAAAFVGASPTRIAVVTASSEQRADWEPFEQAFQGRAKGKVLLIVSAGETARDLDAAALYPAALGLADMLVVTACDGDGKIVADSGHGVRSVDVAIAVPSATDSTNPRLAPVALAVARAAALAARLAAASPDADTARLKARLVERAKPMPPTHPSRTRHGCIAAPERD